MKKAYIINNVVHDISAIDPYELFHPDIAKLYDTEIPVNVERDWILDTVTNTWNPPEIIPITIPDIVLPKYLSTIQFVLLFTAAERVALRAARSTDPIIDDLFIILEDKRLTSVDMNSTTVKDAISYFVLKSFLTQPRADTILSGIAP